MPTRVVLTCLGPDGAVRRVSAKPAGTRIGRGDDCQLLLSDPTISRHHAVVRSDDGVWYVVDLGSANGTLLNGIRVEHARLRDGDRVQLGNQTISVVFVQTPSVLSPAAIVGVLAVVGVVSLIVLAGGGRGPVALTPAPAVVAAAQPTAIPAAVAPTAPRALPTSTAQALPTASLPLSLTPTPSLEETIARVKRSTVIIVVGDAQRITGSGSGVSIQNGQIITANHVVANASRIAVRVGSGQIGSATVLRTDPKRDLAILGTEFTSEPSADFADGKELRSGEGLVAIGYPMADEIGADAPTVTRGIFSSRWQGPNGVWHIQTDTPVNPGNSGGPLIDSQGRVVGIAVFGVKGTVGLNYAVAGDEVQAFINGW